jgi:hypothetical protein
MHISVTNSVRKLKQAVGQCTFAMVNMCNNAKIPNILHTRQK